MGDDRYDKKAAIFAQLYACAHFIEQGPNAGWMQVLADDWVVWRESYTRNSMSPCDVDGR